MTWGGWVSPFCRANNLAFGVQHGPLQNEEPATNLARGLTYENIKPSGYLT